MKNWPAQTVKKRQVSDLVPYARNSRTHSEEQIAQIAASIKEWGWTNPVLIDEDAGIIAGHGRILAAQKLGIKEVPCMVATGWTKAQKQAYIIADNKLALNAGWDEELLSLELSEIGELDFDLGLIGFSDLELNSLLADRNEGNTDPDDVPELQPDPISDQGNIWLLDRHRICCGDSTSATDVAALLNGVEPHLMVTDPPYGVNYDANWRNQTDLANGKPYGGRAVGKVQNDDRADWTEAYALFPGDVAYVWHPAGALQNEFYQNLSECGFDVRMQIIWAKSRFPIGRGNYHVQHEPCWYAVRKKSGSTAHWQGSRKESTLWTIDHQKSETGHSTQKPVECMRRPIVNNSSPGQVIYEPFSGSGTTLIAGEMEGRHVYAMELHPPYVDLAVRRWQEFSGKQATLEGDGRTFLEIESERLGAAA